MFDISLTSELIGGLDPGETAVYGRITIGDFSEELYVGLASWDREKYEHQWKVAIARIVAGAGRSALIVSYIELLFSHYVMLWPMYRDGETVYIQNRMLFFDQLSKPFSTDRPWDSLQERETISPEGERISEWVTDIDSLRAYLEKNE
jgi:hypothetical protein